MCHRLYEMSACRGGSDLLCKSECDKMYCSCSNATGCCLNITRCCLVSELRYLVLPTYYGITYLTMLVTRELYQQNIRLSAIELSKILSNCFHYLLPVDII